MKKAVLFTILLAVLINGVYAQTDLLKSIKLCTELKEYTDSGIKISAYKREKWLPGQTLRVKFLDGDEFVHSKLKEFATEWSKYCSIKFTFVTSGAAEIRISFVTGKGSWSIIGKTSATNSVNDFTGNIYKSSTGATMNFSWFDRFTTDEEFRRTIVHEFGHAIGLIHEHQSPAAQISWNKPIVYEYYRTTQGWTQGEVDENIFKKYAKSETQYSAYDKLSIMHYAIPQELLLNPIEAVGWNTKLSDVDKFFIPQIYPPLKQKAQKKQTTKDHDAHTGDIQGGMH